MVNSYLAHYGVKGMKWGVRKDRHVSGLSRRAKTGNLNLFGLDGHNALFITGLSGSGKSTIAIELAPKINAEIIHLDSYFEKAGSGNNKDFNSFLKKNGVSKEKMFINGKLNYSESDKILPLIKKYPKKVIVEGVQLLDNTLSDSARDFLRNEPMISLQVAKSLSTKRAMDRDDVPREKINEMLEQANEAYKRKTEMEKELGLSIGKNYVDQLIKERVEND